MSANESVVLTPISLEAITTHGQAAAGIMYTLVGGLIEGGCEEDAQGQVCGFTKDAARYVAATAREWEQKLAAECEGDDKSRNDPADGLALDLRMELLGLSALARALYEPEDEPPYLAPPMRPSNVANAMMGLAYALGDHFKDATLAAADPEPQPAEAVA